MKKSFLILLSSILAVFLITGCADDTTSNNGGNGGSQVSPEVIQQLKTYAGDYEISFFYTDGGKMLSIASDCNQVEQYTGTADAKCVSGTNDVTMKGYGTITVADNGDVSVTTKMQMTNANLQLGEGGLWAAAKNNQYNYTVFNTIPASTIDLNTMTLNAINPVAGVTGRNLTVNTNYPKNTYTFTLMADGSIKNNIVDTSSGITNANVTVIMKKIASIPSGYTLEKDVKFPEPVIEGFVDAPAN